jgi:hypothetical protein
MRFRFTVPLAVLLLLTFSAVGGPAFSGDSAPRSQDSSDLPNASAVVKPRAYVSLDSVPRGSQFQIAIVVDIARGFHMNSHKPTDAYLIPTTLTPKLPAGIQMGETIYPEGRSEKFSFSPDKPLNVYTGSVTVRLKLSASANAALGAISLPLTLRYQACNDSACLPPAKVPVVVSLQIGPAGSKARSMHPDIFPASLK